MGLTVATVLRASGMRISCVRYKKVTLLSSWLYTMHNKILRRQEVSNKSATDDLAHIVLLVDMTFLEPAEDHLPMETI